MERIDERKNQKDGERGKNLHKSVQGNVKDHRNLSITTKQERALAEM